jgi:broad specificity phosphatase PhoE
MGKPNSTGSSPAPAGTPVFATAFNRSGRRQAQAVARLLLAFNLARLITSPYGRALETARIIAEHLSVPITVGPLIAERFSFICGISSPLAELRAGWPDLGFGHLPGPWWTRAEETEEMIRHRSQSL